MYIDTHVDVLYHMKAFMRKFSPQSDDGHIDLARARKGEFLAGFFAIFPTENSYYIDEGARRWLDFIADSNNHMRFIKNSNDLKKLITERKNEKSEEDKNIGAIMHIEGAAGIDTSLHKLYILYECGLRSIGLTWNETNHFATGTGGDKNRGLTKEGEDLISSMDDLGIILDVSHLNDKSFWDVVDKTNKPILASHSNLRKRANHRRNLTNEMVKEIAKTDGSIGINFHKGFLSTDDEHPANRFCAMEMIQDIISITGNTDHVHIGSDFDGCSVPEDIKDVSFMPTFFLELKDRINLTNEEIEKIQYKNVMRVIESNWK
ncbi:MAG: dipeptidase [Candidatus Hodarchaeales archaeon]|jgi:membrane dipeptidase